MRSCAGDEALLAAVSGLEAGLRGAHGKIKMWCVKEEDELVGRIEKASGEGLWPGHLDKISEENGSFVGSRGGIADGVGKWHEMTHGVRKTHSRDKE